MVKRLCAAFSLESASSISCQFFSVPIKQLGHGLVDRERAARFNDFTQTHVNRFDGIRGVNNFMNFSDPPGNV